MFGFLRGPVRSPEYRRAYARVCSHQHREFGLRTLPVLSYEAVFLYCLAIDHGLTPAPQPGAPVCCRLRRDVARVGDEDQVFARLASAMGLVLLAVKLRDDVRDNASSWARGGLWWWGRPIAAAESVLTERDPDLLPRLQRRVEAHCRLERTPTTWRDAPNWLATYCEPTAEAFADVFVLASEAAGRTDLRASLGETGRRVGRAIVAVDCARDLQRDRRRGDFNPLQSPADVEAAWGYGRQQLAELAWGFEETAERLRGGALTSQIARATLQRCQAPSPRAGRAAAGKPRRRLAIGRARRAHPAGECDCCAEALCQLDCCGESLGAACGHSCADGAACCDICSVCYLPCECFGGGAPAASGAVSPPDSSVSRAWEGRAAVTDSPLKPAGTIVIDGVRVPARTHDGCWLDQGAKVIINSGDERGVIVRPR